ncbi:hypothetical protein K1719_046371 [Acacia pycnantha]|nr:hypothetical protein K1719_046371 [Acacia pycnantha]
MKRTLASKVENLIEVTHHPDHPIRNTELPLLSPYSVYHRNNTFTSSIRTLTRTRRPHTKEVVQSTKLEQCTLPATPQEQYSTIEISLDLVDLWKYQCYTHIQFGAIRLVLTLHGRKGLPVIAKVALLDSTYKKYSDALIGALLTTLNNGSVILTIQPDYNIQITGAEQDSQAIMATLHHQIIYRLQSHALDLSLPNSTNDAFVAISNRVDDTSIIQIPCQIPKEELVEIMPMEWISNYEKLFHVGEDSDDEQGLYPSNLFTTFYPSLQSPPPLTKSSKDMSLVELIVDQNTRVPSRPYVVPNTVDAQGNFQSIQAKEVLNWQTQNIVCQNTTLRRIDSKLDSLTTKTDGLAYQINQLSEEVKNLYLYLKH